MSETFEGNLPPVQDLSEGSVERFDGEPESKASEPTETPTVKVEAVEVSTPVEKPVESAPVVEKSVETPVEEKVFSQEAVDRLLGAQRREGREKREALEARIAELEAEKEKFHTATLAARLGVKEEILSKTGLKGAELDAYARDLASAIGATTTVKAPGVSIENLGASSEHGINLTPAAKAPKSVEDARVSLANLFAGFDEA